MKLLSILLISSFSFSQKLDTIKQKQKTFLVELNSYNIVFGKTALLTAYYDINMKNSIGFSTGIFHFQNKSKYDKSLKMKYIYFPFYVNYKFQKKKNFFIISLGANILSYFDSDYYVLKRDGNSMRLFFWPNYKDIEMAGEIKHFKRNKHWFILSPSYNFKIHKGLNFSTGLTFYIGNKDLFSYLNLGINYHFSKNN
jgi:hypothetical protein